MIIGLSFRERWQALGQWALDEWDRVIAALQSWARQEHNDDGSHGSITVDRIVVRTPSLADQRQTATLGGLDIGRWRFLPVHAPTPTYDLEVQERSNDQTTTYTLRGAWRKDGRFSALYGLQLGQIVRPSTLALGQTNNYAPSGYANASSIWVTADAGGSQLGGLTILPHGTVIVIGKAAGGALDLIHDSGASSGRFLLPGSVDLTIPTNGSIALQADETLGKWLTFGSIG